MAFDGFIRIDGIEDNLILLHPSNLSMRVCILIAIGLFKSKGR